MLSSVVLEHKQTVFDPQLELFDKFLMYSEGREPPFEAQDTLRAWQEKVDQILHFIRQLF